MVVEETDWVARLKSSDDVQEAALAELREILIRGLTATLRNRYGSKVQPEDVVQEALIRILKKLDSFQGRSKFTTWAMTVAVRIAISEMRRKYFQDVSIEELATKNMQFEPSAPDQPIVDDPNRKKNVLSLLRELIETKLSEKQRSAIHALLNGIPVEVFAEKTGSNRNAVYKLVHDARTKLRKGFADAGVESDDLNSVFA